MISLTIILVAMTVLVSYQAFNNPATKHKLLFHPASVREFGEWHRFLTSGFVHANWEHLLINMFVLYQFGDFLEYVFTTSLFDPTVGRVAFLFFYLSAIVVADIPTFVKHQDNTAYASLGASGATSALVMAYVLFQPWAWFLFPPLPGILFAAAFLWYSSYMARRGGDNIAHDAHLWGAVYGIVFMLVLTWAVNPGLLQFFIQQFLQGPSLPNF